MPLREKVKISSDSTADFTESVINENDIDIKYLSFINSRNNSVSRDDGTLVKDTLFKIFQDGHQVTTSCPSIGEYEDSFEKHLKDYEYLFHFSISSELSASYQNALIASDVAQNRIFVFDTKKISVAQQLIVLNAIDYLNEMTNIYDVIHEINYNIPRTEILIMLQTLKYAILGGRLQKELGSNLGKKLERPAAAVSDVVAGAGVKFLLGMKDGKITSPKATIGSGIKVASNYFGSALKNAKENDDLALKRIGLAATSDIKSLDLIADNILEKYIEVSPNENNDLPEDKIENIVNVDAGTVMSIHSGPNAYCMAYTKKRI